MRVRLHDQPHPRIGVRRPGGVVVLAGLVVALSGVPSWVLGPMGPAPVRATGECTGWMSASAPPPTIRVLRTAGPAAGTVQVVPFQPYVTVVMAAEWGPGDPAEALKAGAVAVKEYGWYHAMFWRGGTAADGSCYDVVDSSMDQVYAPETETPSASEVGAVDATWGISLLKSGVLFATHYGAGSDVGCGVNADGWHLYQVSAMRCAQQGMLAAAILQTYYGPNVTIVGGASPGSGTAAALRFDAQPLAGTAGASLAAPPTVSVIDGTGQPVTIGAAGSTVVTLAIGAGPPGAALSCTGGPTRTAVGGVATFDGCSVSVPGAGYVLVASAAGLAAATTQPFAVEPAAPTLSLAVAGGTITWGTAVVFSIRLVPPTSGGSVASRVVHLQESIDGRDWTTVADVTTGALGDAGFSERPAANLLVRAAFDGTTDLGPTTSPPQRVLVRQLALLRPDTRGTVRRVTRGATVAFITLVRPARADQPPGRVLYRLYQLVGRSWTLRREATVTADASGRARFSVAFATPGSWYVRAMAIPSPTNANSAWSQVQRYLVG